MKSLHFCSLNKSPSACHFLPYQAALRRFVQFCAAYCTSWWRPRRLASAIHLLLIGRLCEWQTGAANRSVKLKCSVVLLRYDVNQEQFSGLISLIATCTHDGVDVCAKKKKEQLNRQLRKQRRIVHLHRNQAESGANIVQSQVSAATGQIRSSDCPLSLFFVQRITECS